MQLQPWSSVLKRMLGARQTMLWTRMQSTASRATPEMMVGSQRIALLIDGDQNGPTNWPPALRALESRGKVVRKCVFGLPKLTENKRWKDSCSALGLEFLPVPRTAGGAKDPNDMAIAMEAARLVARADADTVALLVNDRDFLYVAQRLQSWGHRTMLLLREGGRNGLAKAFADVEAEVVRFKGEEGHHEARQPNFQIVLQSNGESSIELSSADPNPSQDHSLVASKLKEFDYLLDSDDPLIPPIAKFFHAHCIGPLTVWPPKCLGEARAVFESAGQQRWQKNNWDTVFIFPRALEKNTKRELQEYGTKQCSSHVRGGGPFILQDSETLVERVLRRLGYLDDAFNSDLGEAIDVFCGAGVNRRNLVSLGLTNVERFGVQTKRALLHGALVSPRLHGHWQIAPNDSTVREKLAAMKLVSAKAAPLPDVICGLQLYAKQQHLPEMKSYNGMVAQFLARMNEMNPTKRT